MGNIIHLNHDNVLDAVMIGQKQTQQSSHRKDNWGLKNDDPIKDARRQTVGFLGEMAVSSCFHVPFEPMKGAFKDPDVYVNGWGLQVKSSELQTPISLTIRPDAKDFEPYILCRVNIPTGDPRDWHIQERLLAAKVEILGWIFPYIARLWNDIVDGALIRDPNGRNSPAIFMPQHYLENIEFLKELTNQPSTCYDLS